MTDLILAQSLRQARTSIKYLDSTGATRGVYTGVPQTTNYGGDRIGATIDFTSFGGNQTSEKSLRAQLQAFFMALRGKTNRVYLTDSSYTRRGSFPSSELLVNSDFSSGASGWSSGAKYALSSADNMMRATVTSGGAGATMVASQTISGTQYSPHAIRALMFPRRGNWVSNQIYRYLDGSAISAFPSAAGYGVDVQVLNNASVTAGIYDNSTSGPIANDILDIPFISVSRCALVDGGSNQLVRSDELDNAAWTKTALTVVANNNTAPDGTVTADALQETTANSNHQVAQTITISSSAQDICWCIAWSPGTRSWVNLVMTETTGSTSVQTYFNASTGATGTTAIGANWANLRTFVVDMGSSWKYLCIVARKTNAATSIQARAHVASANGTDSYVGTAAVTAAAAWRATLALSSVPVRLVQSTSAAVSASSQLGIGLYIKGLPASTNGLLLVGDWIEIDGQLKMVTASLDSDSSGLGYIQFSPPLRRAISDNTPIIVHRPMGRFMLASNDSGWSNEPGVFSQATIELEEAFV